MSHTFDPVRLKEVIYWVQERERVRVKHDARARGQWSDDPAFQTIRFCNVFRELDRVTCWIRDNWREPYLHHPSLPVAMVIARLVNHTDTLAMLGFPENGWNPYHFKDVLQYRKALGQKVWTNAYMVTGGYSEGGESKEVIIARVIDGADKAFKAGPPPSTLKGWNKYLTVPGIGPFLRAQVIADLKYTPVLQNAPDWWSWCNPGPGSVQGMNFLCGLARSKSWPYDDFVAAVNDLRTHIPFPIHAQDTQNVLCEYSKWYKFTHLKTGPKNKYVRVP